jgi:hypothetical protein
MNNMDEVMTTIRILIKILDKADGNDAVVEFLFDQLDDAIDAGFNEGMRKYEMAFLLGDYRDVLDEFGAQ